MSVGCLYTQPSAALRPQNDQCGDYDDNEGKENDRDWGEIQPQ